MEPDKTGSVTLALAHLRYWWTMNNRLNPRLAPSQLRENFEKLTAVPRSDLTRKFPDLVIEDEGEKDLAIESLRVGAPRETVLLYFHGGGYFMGSIASYRYWTLRLAYRCNVTVWTPEYRLAPEYPFPAALEDATRAYRRLLRRHPEKRILLGGDSAGGGLALATLMALRDAGDPMPRGAFLVSPYADLTATSRSMKANRFKDHWLSAKAIRRWAPLYHGSTSAADPRVSPVGGNFAGLPPLLILAAGNEVLLGDSVTIAERARAAGVEATLEIYPRMQHAWAVALPQLAESKAAIRSIERFCSRG